MFYGTLGASESRITPAPLLNISTELSYSNDTVIGYNYTINLSGQITAIDLADGSSSGQFGIGSIIDHAHKIRKILSQNGNILTVTDDYSSETPILKAKGGILRSFNISDSPNNWINYVNYTATIEFQAIEFIGASWKQYTQEDCSNIFLSSDTYGSNSSIVDISKYKIKSFDDSWSFNFDETEAYNKHIFNGTNIDNTSFTIEYSISATGKNSYIYTNEDTSEVKIVPAWEQAKNFVQYRLYNQVRGLISNVLDTNKGTACAPQGDLSSLTEPGGPGLMSGVGDSLFSLFNETINCDVSESEGTYSVSYTAVAKRNANNNFSTANTRHKISKSVSTERANGSIVNNVKVNGSIEGLTPGGLIKTGGVITLPEKGSFFIHSQTLNHNKNFDNAKYANALALSNQIVGYTGNNEMDLTSLFKNALGIGYNYPVSFNLTHDHINGTINYSVEYSSNRECGRQKTITTVQTDASVPVIAKFDIPNSGSGPFLQSLDTRTSKKVTITVQGSDTNKCNNNGLLSNIFASSSPPVHIPAMNGLLIENKYTRNLKDGSFTLVKTYIDSTGCGAF